MGGGGQGVCLRGHGTAPPRGRHLPEAEDPLGSAGHGPSGGLRSRSRPGVPGGPAGAGVSGGVGLTWGLPPGVHREGVWKTPAPQLPSPRPHLRIRARTTLGGLLCVWASLDLGGLGELGWALGLSPLPGVWSALPKPEAWAGPKLLLSPRSLPAESAPWWLARLLPCLQTRPACRGVPHRSAGVYPSAWERVSSAPVRTSCGPWGSGSCQGVCGGSMWWDVCPPVTAAAGPARPACTAPPLTSLLPPCSPFLPDT